MATEQLDIEGTVSWVRADKPNQWNKWAFTIHPNAEGLEKIRDLQAEGLKNQLKKDEDGYFCNFSRPTSAVIRGKVVGFAPPLMWDADGKTPLRENVGNGSKAVARMEVYSHKTPGGGTAKAARWTEMKVTDLVPWRAAEGGFDEAPKREGMYGVQGQVF